MYLFIIDSIDFFMFRYKSFKCVDGRSLIFIKHLEREASNVIYKYKYINISFSLLPAHMYIDLNALKIHLSN